MVRVLLEVVSMGSAAAQASAALVPAFHVPLDRQLARRAHSPASCCRRRRVHEGDRLSGAASLDHIGFGLRAANDSAAMYRLATMEPLNSGSIGLGVGCSLNQNR